MKFRELVEIDLEYLNKIVELEEEAFEGQGGVDLWILKALIRYEKVFVLEDKNGELVSVLEFMQVFEKKEAFLYGICTRKKYRRQGWAEYILDLGEKYLKEKFYHGIALTVDPKNEIAIHLYKNKDYKVLELQENEYGEGIHRLLMKKSLE